VGQDPFRIDRDRENEEILEGQRNTEVQHSSTQLFERLFHFSSTHATETSSVDFHSQKVSGTAGKTHSLYAYMNGIVLQSRLNVPALLDRDRSSSVLLGSRFKCDPVLVGSKAV